MCLYTYHFISILSFLLSFILSFLFFFFFFNDTATTEIYTLSLHDALPIYANFCLKSRQRDCVEINDRPLHGEVHVRTDVEDRKSTRLNSSHTVISYAVFCLKKKKKQKNIIFAKKA